MSIRAVESDQTRVLLIFAHPYPERSRANHTLLSRVEDLPGVEVRSLYDLYPGFDIDVQAEQAALLRAHTVVWQHPIYWYSVPALLKHWFDKVLVRGFAYGEQGDNLHGKRCLWVATTGGPESSYSPEGMHAHPFEKFVPVVEQTARFCGMHWEQPLIVHGAHQVTQTALDHTALAYRERIQNLLQSPRSAL